MTQGVAANCDSVGLADALTALPGTPLKEFEQMRKRIGPKSESTPLVSVWK